MYFIVQSTASIVSKQLQAVTNKKYHIENKVFQLRTKSKKAYIKITWREQNISIKNKV